MRLVALDPADAAHAPQAVRDWLRHVEALQRRGVLHWTTMGRYAHFANQRHAVEWGTDPDPLVPRTDVLQASHPRSLAHFAWLLPVARYAEPHVLEGIAQVARDGGFWRVVAGPGTRLRLQLPMQPGAGAAVQPPAQ
ncbi:hypothetical protein [Pseudorhodoferax sp. Leaf267]|uniref:hypothetical protein n=1 Tax=Pseudorhodoferax sp. Leaf267 TaxID=1736316 RepID=UPI0006FB7268|nr:hypothetical protein [Pseudorhodoferax sp. Leaf267]KQP13109.1 hypothetical protein ASF43_18520 [Pseudorhodoferax sp. Leaf267]